MTDLYDEHLEHGGVGIVHDRFTDLKEWNYRPEYIESKVVPSSSEDHAYLVSKISVLAQPFPDADIAADRFQTYLCSCPAFYFQESNGLETNETHPTDIGKCKHVLAAFKHERAKQDENQSELTQ